MKTALVRLWKEDDAVLSFEWILLVTLLTIGIVGGIASARDAIIDELGDVAQMMLAVDQSYYINFPLEAQVHAPTISGTSDSEFIDFARYTDCERVDGTDIPDQGIEVNSDEEPDGGLIHHVAIHLSRWPKTAA